MSTENISSKTASLPLKSVSLIFKLIALRYTCFLYFYLRSDTFPSIFGRRTDRSAETIPLIQVESKLTSRTTQVENLFMIVIFIDATPGLPGIARSNTA